MTIDERIEALAAGQLNLQMGRASLQAAMAGLVGNQAAFHSNFLAMQAQFNERFSRIEAELVQIRAILLRHEQMLAALPEAVRQRIGFGREEGRQ